MLGQVRRHDREPVGESGDSRPCDRETFEVGLVLPQPGLQFADPGAEVVGQAPGGALLDAERVGQGPDVHVLTVCGSRQVGCSRR